MVTRKSNKVSACYPNPEDAKTVGASRPYGAARRYNDAIGCWANLMRQAERRLNLNEENFSLLEEALIGVRLDPRLQDPGRFLADIIADHAPPSIVRYVEGLPYIEAWALYLRAVR